MNTTTRFASRASSTNATLPPPSIGTAIDGGLGYYDLVDRTANTYVSVGPIPKANTGDSVTIFWAGSAVAVYSVKNTDLGNVFPIPVINAKIADAGDGDKVLTYTVTYQQGQGEESSDPPVLITVKRTVPCGLDPLPGTPENDNMVKAVVSPSPVPPEATAVTVTVPLWINPAQNDIMVVSWNGAMFFAAPLPSPSFPGTVTVTLTAAEVLNAGVGPAVPVTWGVHDKVANWSNWAATTEVDVRIEDPGLLLAPHVGDKDTSWTQIDLIALGGKDLEVFTPDYDGALKDDVVTVHLHGTALDGSTITFDSPPQSMPEPGYGLTFQIPNAKLVALTGGNVRVWYTVIGRPASHSVWLPVIGAAQGDLPVPVVAEAVDSDNDGLADWLDPDKADPSAHVTIEYPTMARDDLVTLVLEGKAADGTPVKITASKQIGTPAPIEFQVLKADILKFLDIKAEIYYLVSPFSRRPTFSRALGELESAHLVLDVRRGSAVEPLPVPAVKDNAGKVIDQGGYLDPGADYAEALATYPNPEKNDEITYTWVGTVSTRTEMYRVRDAATLPTDTADRNFIVTNDGGSVKVSYSVVRRGTEPATPSLKLEFQIGVDDPLAIDQTRLTLSNTPPVQGHQATGGVTPYTYSSSNPNIVKVTNASTGMVEAVTNGNTRIVVHDSATPPNSVSYPVTATDKTDLLTIDTTLLTLTNTSPKLGHQAKGGLLPYTYTSSDTKIVKVTDAAKGIIQAVTDGSVTITVRDSAKPPQSVNYPVKAVGMIDFTVGTTLITLTDTTPRQGHQAIGGVKPYTYSSSNSNVVTVTNASTGMVQAVSNGSAEITVKDSATPAHSGKYPVKSVINVPFDIDGALLAVTNTAVVEGHQATGGVKPYTYSTSNPNVVNVVDASMGTLKAVNSGMATIEVRDSATPQNSDGYPVRVENLINFDLYDTGLIPSGSSRTVGFLTVKSIVGRGYLGKGNAGERGLAIGYEFDHCTMQITPNRTFTRVSFTLFGLNDTAIVQFYKSNTLLEKRPITASAPNIDVPVSFQAAGGFSHFTITPGSYSENQYDQILVHGIIMFS